MKIFILSLFSLLIIGCMETPDAPTSKVVLAQEKIQSNKTEAQKAQDEYLELQRQRNNE